MIGGDGGHRRKVSAIGARTVSPARTRSGFDFATEVNGDVTADKVVAFLRGLLRHLRGKVVVIWDGGPNRHGPVIREFLRRNTRRRRERLPAYAPDRNPAEMVWSWLEWGRLANFVPDDRTDLDDGIVEYLVALKHDPKLLRALWERSDLPFPKPPPDE